MTEAGSLSFEHSGRIDTARPSSRQKRRGSFAAGFALTLHLEMLEIGMMNDRASDMMLRQRVAHHTGELRDDAIHLVDLVDERRRIARRPVARLVPNDDVHSDLDCVIEQ